MYKEGMDGNQINVLRDSEIARQARDQGNKIPSLNMRLQGEKGCPCSPPLSVRWGPLQMTT